MSPRAVAKLIAPRTKDIVRRGRVLTAIERALRSGSCWVAAPAGYGKTTALADFLRRKPTPHVWYRVDEGDQDIASFFHYMAQSLRGARAAPRLPVFGPEYADQPREFARRFFRAYFAKLPLDALLVLDDLHHADVPQFREILAILLGELPDNLRCVCVSRTLPPPQVAELRFKGRLTIVDQATLEFSDREARALIATRVRRRAARVDASPAHGWAAGLVLLAERAAATVCDGRGHRAVAGHSIPCGSRIKATSNCRRPRKAAPETVLKRVTARANMTQARAVECSRRQLRFRWIGCMEFRST